MKLKHYHSIARITAVVLFFLVSVQTQAYSQLSNQDDYTALRAFYLATDGDNWTINNGWPDATTFAASETIPAGSNMAHWHGVAGKAGRVWRISLSGNNLAGSLPAEIGDLSGLGSLRLTSNNLIGEIPQTLGELSMLKDLSLLGNDLTGSIPVELGNLMMLESLSLASNNLSGMIPIEFGQLESLIYLHLYSNQLTGPIPSELGQLGNLLTLFISNNRFSGSIPPELGELQALRNLELSNNSLTGEIPKELGDMTSLSSLSIGGNLLSGSIPKEIGNLQNLLILYLYQNRLSGNIPKEIGDLSNLSTLFLRNNQLTGSIPPELGNLSKLRTATLRNNQLSGNIPSELGQLESLQVLLLNNNQLTGEIPVSFNQLSNLKSIGLQYNELSGCYDAALKLGESMLCNFSNQNISTGNNFDAPWENFCASDEGACVCADDLVTASYSNPVCDGNSFQLFASSDDTSLSYSWFGPNEFSSTEQNPIVTELLSPGEYTYTVSVLSSETGCEDESNITVAILESPICIITVLEEDDCSGNSVTLSATATGGNLLKGEEYTYQWVMNGVLLNGETNQTYTATEKGDYDVLVSDAYCETSASYSIDKECETAWAFLDGQSHCINDYCTNSNWGFTTLIPNGEYTMDLIQGAPYACQGNGSTGTKVGKVTVIYDGINNPTLNFNLSNEGYFLETVHIYSGYGPVAKKGNKCQMAPGKFNDKYDLDKVENTSITLTNPALVGGDIWIAIHVEACQFICDEVELNARSVQVNPIKLELDEIELINPVFGEAIVKLPGHLVGKNIEMSIVSINYGKVMMQKKYRDHNETVRINVENLHSGLYVLLVNDGENLFSTNMVVIR